MPRVKIEMEAGTTVTTGGSGVTVEQDRRDAIQVGSGKTVTIWMNVQANATTATTDVIILGHFDRDAPTGQWAQLNSTALQLAAGETGLKSITVSDPPDWIIWQIKDGTANAALTFSAVAYVDEG